MWLCLNKTVFTEISSRVIWPVGHSSHTPDLERCLAHGKHPKGACWVDEHKERQSDSMLSPRAWLMSEVTGGQEIWGMLHMNCKLLEGLKQGSDKI